VYSMLLCRRLPVRRAMLLMLPRSKLRNHGRGWLWPPWRKTSSCRRNAASLSLQIVLTDLVAAAEIAAAMIVRRVLHAPAARARRPSPILLHQRPRAHHDQRHIVVALPERLCKSINDRTRSKRSPPCQHVHHEEKPINKPAGPANAGLYSSVLLYVSIPDSLPRVAGAPPCSPTPVSHGRCSWTGLQAKHQFFRVCTTFAPKISNQISGFRFWFP